MSSVRPLLDNLQDECGFIHQNNVLAHFELGTVQYKNPYSELGKI